MTYLTTGLGAGNQWQHFTLTGAYTFLPDDPASASYAGTFTLADGASDNMLNFVTTAITNIHLLGSDGSRLDVHDASHLTILNPSSANPTVVVDFARATC